MMWGLEPVKQVAQQALADSLLLDHLESNYIIPMGSFVCANTVLKTKILKLLHNCFLIWEIHSQWVLQMLYTKHTLHTIRKN